MSVFTHHENAATFQQAVKLGCILCTRLRSSFELEGSGGTLEYPEDENRTFGRTAYERAPVGGGPYEAVAIFRCGVYVAHLVLELYNGERLDNVWW